MCDTCLPDVERQDSLNGAQGRASDAYLKGKEHYTVLLPNTSPLLTKERAAVMLCVLLTAPSVDRKQHLFKVTVLFTYLIHLAFLNEYLCALAPAYLLVYSLSGIVTS
jgi:hypothetical protein